MSYIRRINEKYIKRFRTQVESGISSLVRVSNSTVLKVILDEVNKLFGIMSGKLMSRKEIPKGTDFPDSSVHNELLSDIDTDLEKIYSAQAIIEDDVQNLVNFNSVEREKAIKNLSSTTRSEACTLWGETCKVQGHHER